MLNATDKPVFVVEIIRHGDRTPITPIPSVDYVWKEGLGQLTAEGMQQEFQLGVALRKRYIQQDHLLPEHYEYNTLYVRSTDYARTLMSAQSLLAGLYPPGTGPYPSQESSPALPHAIQPIPIFSAPARYDDVILQPINSEEWEKLMAQYVYTDPTWQQKDNELKSKYPLWSQLTRVRIKNLSDLDTLGNTLNIHRIHHAPMPTGLSEADIDTIIKAGQWAFSAQLRPKPIAAAYSSKLMNNIARYLELGSHDNEPLKYILLSAHDTTIATALSFLDAPLDTPPPYASHLSFSLYEQSANQFIVKVSYNDTPVYLPGCHGYACDLQQFVHLIKSECRVKTRPTITWE
jgi:acid phosphatase